MNLHASDHFRISVYMRKTFFSFLTVHIDVRVPLQMACAFKNEGLSVRAYGAKRVSYLI